MTMKTKKTLQHIAAVSVVLLTLCLVFAAPVAAKDVVLEIENSENTGSAETTFTVKVNDVVVLTGQNFQQIFMNHTFIKKGETLLDDGDIVRIDAGDVYIGVTSHIVDIYGNISIIGAGEGKTNITASGIWGGKDIRLTSHTSDGSSYANGIIYKFNFSDLTFRPANSNAKHALFISDYNIEVNVVNVSFDGYSSSVFRTITSFADDGTYPSDKKLTTTINLKNVETSGDGVVLMCELLPWNSGYTGCLSSCSLNFDENTVFNNIVAGKKTYVSNGKTVTYDTLSSAPFQKNLFINGVDITLDSAVAKIGDTYYGTLQDAVNKAAENDVITLLANVEINTGILIEKSLTITSDAGQKYSITNDNEVTGNEGAAIVVNKDDITLKLDNIIVNADHYAVRIWNDSTVQITNSEISGWSALYFKEGSDGAEVTVSKSTLVGTNNQANPASNDFGTIVCEDSNVTVAVADSVVKAVATTAANQSIVVFSSHYGPNSYDKVTFTGGELVLDKGSSASVFVDTAADAQHDSVVIGEGVTANFNPSAYIAGGMEVVQPGDKYLVQTYVDRSSSSSSSTPVEPEQPEEPVEPTPETPAAPGEVVSSTEVTDGGDVTFETPAGEDGTAPAAADDEVKGVVLPTGTEGTVEFVPVSETPAPAGQEENTKRVFEINVPSYKKGEASVIKFQMTVAEIEADGKTAADVALWHYDEETGEWTKLVTSFIIKDGIVYFEAITNDFSPFAIVYADEPAEELPTDQPEEPTETPASPAPVLAVIAALGAAVVLRRK